MAAQPDRLDGVPLRPAERWRASKVETVTGWDSSKVSSFQKCTWYSGWARHWK